jgi:integrase
LSALQPLWQAKPETASRLRGRIEAVLDAARVQGLRSGENPARWRGHLDKLLPRARKLSRGHFAAMPYDKVPAFMAALRERESIAALALEFLILTAGEALGTTWQEIDLEGHRCLPHEGRPGTSCAASWPRVGDPQKACRCATPANSFFPASGRQAVFGHGPRNDVAPDES